MNDIQPKKTIETTDELIESLVQIVRDNSPMTTAKRDEAKVSWRVEMWSQISQRWEVCGVGVLVRQEECREIALAVLGDYRRAWPDSKYRLVRSEEVVEEV